MSVYCWDRYIVPDVSDIRSSLEDRSSAECSMFWQDSRNEKSTDAGSSFSSAPTMVGTPEAWVIPTTPNIRFPMKGFGDSEGGGKKTVRWCLYMEDMGTSNCSSFELMLTERG